MAQIHVSPLYEHNLPSQNTFYLQCTYCGSKETCSLSDMTKFIYKKHFFAHVCRCHRTHYFERDDLILLYTAMYVPEEHLVNQINMSIDPITKQIQVRLIDDDYIDLAHTLFNQYMTFIDTLEST